VAKSFIKTASKRGLLLAFAVVVAVLGAKGHIVLHTNGFFDGPG
jgi:hypothetical protein